MKSVLGPGHMLDALCHNEYIFPRTFPLFVDFSLRSRLLLL